MKTLVCALVCAAFAYACIETPGTDFPVQPGGVPYSSTSFRPDAAGAGDAGGRGDGTTIDGPLSDGGLGTDATSVDAHLVDGMIVP